MRNAGGGRGSLYAAAVDLLADFVLDAFRGDAQGVRARARRAALAEVEAAIRADDEAALAEEADRLDRQRIAAHAGGSPDDVVLVTRLPDRRARETEDT